MHFARTTLFAHSGEHETQAAAHSDNLLQVIAHQPAWIALLISVVVLAACFGILSLFKLKLIDKLFWILVPILGLSALFFSHNPLVTSLLMSGGFVMVFGVVFTMLGVKRK